jgi:hypothetical protein
MSASQINADPCGSVSGTLVLILVSLFVWCLTLLYRWLDSVQHIIKGGRTAFISLDWPEIFGFLGKDYMRCVREFYFTVR